MSLCGDGDLGHRRLGVLYLTDSATHRCNVAKAKPKKPTRDVPAKSDEPIDPKKVHELFGIVGPYDPPAPPIPTTGYVRWWDCGMSVQTLVKKQPSLFYIPELFDGERCAKDSDSWRWRMWGEPIEPNLQFADQEKKLKTGDQPAAAREVVMYLALVFLTTGEKLDLGRLRTKDRAEMGTLRGRNGHQPQERGPAPYLRVRKGADWTKSEPPESRPAARLRFTVVQPPGERYDRGELPSTVTSFMRRTTGSGLRA